MNFAIPIFVTRLHISYIYKYQPGYLWWVSFMNEWHLTSHILHLSLGSGWGVPESGCPVWGCRPEEDLHAGGEGTLSFGFYMKLIVLDQHYYLLVVWMMFTWAILSFIVSLPNVTRACMFLRIGLVAPALKLSQNFVSAIYLQVLRCCRF